MGKKRERNSDEDKEVEEITGDRIQNGNTQYRVKWMGKAEETWEDEDKLDCEELIQEYLETKEDEEGSENGNENDNDEEAEKEEVPKKKKKPNASDEEEEEFEVDRLLEDRVTDDGKVQYKVRWKGYDSDQDTWEDESNLDCAEIIEEYNNAKGGKTGAAKKGKAVKGKAPKAEGGKKTKKGANSYGDREPDKIVGLHTLKTGKRELLVRWKGEAESEDSWEPEDKLRGTPVHDKFLLKEKQNKEKKDTKDSKSKDDDDEEEE